MKRQKIRKTILNISLVLFPLFFYYLSPVLILEGSYYGVINGSFIVFGLLLVSSIFLGRLWCGWICPGGADGDLCMKIRNKRVSNKINFLKYFIWLPWLLTIAYLAFKAGGYQQVDFFYNTYLGQSINGPESIIAFVVVLTIVTLPNLIFGRRTMCHFMCWMAPFMIIGEKINKLLKLPRVRLKADKEKCVDCMTCTKNCPMSLEVHEMVQRSDMDNVECILCGTCADNCPKKVFAFCFKK